MIPAKSLAAATLSFSIPFMSIAQPAGFNYDEAKVPDYSLPEPLTLQDGKLVKSADDWTHQRRPELLKMFEQEVYGRAPRRPRRIRYEIQSARAGALDGKAIRKEISVYFDRPGREPSMSLLIYIPVGAAQPAPAFLGLNFEGNHAIHKDPEITLSTRWLRANPEKGVIENRATERARGSESSRWPVEMILARGYALATIYYGDIDPDFDDGFKNGVHPLYFNDKQTAPAPDEWGSIAAWSWGLSCALDALEEEGSINARKVALLGHSRLGKTALWAGAADERFAIVISNNSGCGGAALSKRVFGETVERINTAFPHWFCGNFKKYNSNEASLPLDQHELIALIAPRPVYVASAAEDLWADPRGEFLGALHAESVYNLLGRVGLGVTEMPALNQPVGDFIGYHIRSGKHDVTNYDWERYLDFADRHFAEAKKPKRRAKP